MYGEVRVGDSFRDFRNVHPAGATSQDKNLPPVSRNSQRRRKPPDEDSIIS